MHKYQQIFVIGVLICVDWGFFCTAGTPSTKAQAQRVTVSELLDKYAETMEKLQSVVIEAQDRSVSESGASEHYELTELATDGRRVNIKQQAATESFAPESDAYRRWLYDGSCVFTYSRGAGPPKGDTIMLAIDDPNIHPQEWIAIAYGGAALRGFFYGDGPDDRVDKVIRNATKLAVRPKTERVRGSQCYVIDAVTERGNYTLWIDPQHGYHIAKAQVRRNEGDFVYPGLRLPPGLSLSASVGDVRFDKIDGVWLPVEGSMTIGQKNPEGGFSTRKHHRITKISVSPNHDALGSFAPSDIRSGALAYITTYLNESGGLHRCRWVGDRIVDETGEALWRHSGSGTSAFELLQKYAETQDKLESLIAKTEEIVTSKWSGQEKPGTERYVTELRLDSERMYYGYRLWRDYSGNGQAATAEDAEFNYVLWDGRCYVEYHEGQRDSDSEAFISADKDKVKHVLNGAYGGAPFLGVRAADERRIDEVLRGADSISVRSKLERVGSSACHVIDAKTNTGSYTVWIDPNFGYQIVQARIVSGPNDLHLGRRLNAGDAESLFVKDIRVNNIDGVFVPMEAELYLETVRGTGASGKITVQHKITEMNIAPDHATLGSFTPVMQNGTRVLDLGSRIEYRWQDNKLIDSSQNQYTIDEVINPPELAGKRLPPFDDFDLHMPSDGFENVPALLCFWDMGQRPSRQCVQHLCQNQAAITGANVRVILVHIATNNKQTVNTWLKENRVPFASGFIHGESDRVLRRWCVGALPWLTLTDRQHVVVAEGLALAELDEKLHHRAKN